MGAYRYLVFPKHQQPTADEAAELQSFAPLLSGRWAIGRERKTSALAMLFDADVFEQAMTNEEFEFLIRRWQVRGCEIVDKLKFVKDSSALKPTPAQVLERHVSPDKILAAKKYLADEAIARSLLGVQRTLERISWLERLGKAVPYAIIAIGTLALITTGFYVHNRLEKADRERRADTIERMAAEPVMPQDGVPTPSDSLSPISDSTSNVETARQ